MTVKINNPNTFYEVFTLISFSSLYVVISCMKCTKKRISLCSYKQVTWSQKSSQSVWKGKRLKEKKFKIHRVHAESNALWNEYGFWAFSYFTSHFFMLCHMHSNFIPRSYHENGIKDLKMFICYIENAWKENVDFSTWNFLKQY